MLSILPHGKSPLSILPGFPKDAYASVSSQAKPLRDSHNSPSDNNIVMRLSVRFTRSHLFVYSTARKAQFPSSLPYLWSQYLQWPPVSDAFTKLFLFPLLSCHGEFTHHYKYIPWLPDIPLCHSDLFINNWTMYCSLPRIPSFFL